MPKPPEERFWLKVVKTETCWLWVGEIHKGYGRFVIDSRNVRVHRWSYERHIGPIPDGLVIDHLCRVKNCVNPAHLEAVPHRVNVIRGIGVTAVNAAKTHCSRGHGFTTENTMVDRHGQRRCRKCSLMHLHHRRAAARAARTPPGVDQ